MPGPWGVGSPLPAGPKGGPGGPVPRGWILVGLHRQPPGLLLVPPPCLLRGRPPRAGGAGRTGHATGTSVPSFVGCGRPPPCRPPGGRPALRATPGVRASLRLCSTCLHTGGNFVGIVGPRAGGSGTNFLMAPSGAGSKGRLASGTVCGANARPRAAASRASVAGAAPRLWMASRCASACSHSCQRVAPIWQSGFVLHRRLWKACSQWYTVVGTASWSSRSAG